MNPPASVLVVITRRIGDVLLATPVLRSLRRAWPGANIDVLVFVGTEGVLKGNPDLNSIHAIAERPTVGEHLKLLARLWRRYDLALSLLTGDRPTLYAWIAGRRRAGMVSGTPKESWKSRLLQVRVPFDNLDRHTVPMNLQLVEAIGVPASSDVVVSWNDDDVAALDDSIPAARRALPYAVLHPFPKFNYKMWHTRGWVELLRWLEQQGLQVFLSGGGAADEMAYCEEIVRQSGAKPLNLAGMLNLGQLGALLSRASLYVGPDTVVTHMAAALGVPTVALFGPSDPVKWGPWPRGFDVRRNPWRRVGSQAVGNVRLVQGQTHCVPCLQEGCERHVASFSDCLQHLDAARVIAEATLLLRGPAASGLTVKPAQGAR